MAVLDADCLLRWLVRDNPAMTERVDALFRSGQRLRVPDVAVIEMVFVLEHHYKFSRSEVALSVRLLVAQAALDMNRAWWSAIMDEYVRHPKLSCADIFLAIEAQERGDGPLYTFDKKLVSQLNGVEP